MAAPNVGRGGTALAGILVLAADDVWVLGSSSKAEDFSVSGVSTTYLAHWNGESWRTMAPPRGPGWGHYVTSLSGTADDDLWLGGDSPEGDGYPAAAHWDGKHWSVYGPKTFEIDRSGSGDRGTTGSDDPTVVAASATDVWFNPEVTYFWSSPSSKPGRGGRCADALPLGRADVEQGQGWLLTRRR